VTPPRAAADAARSTPAPSYAAPAAERTLDVLEQLAAASGPMSQSQIAQAIGIPPAQIFRVLGVLQRRGYLARDPASGLYSLTMRLHELAHRQEPIATLRAVAEPSMRALAHAIGQSCNLGRRIDDDLVIVAEAESASPFGFRVRVGAAFPLVGTTSGELLLALDPDAPDPEDPELVARLAALRRAGHGERRDALHPGVTDLAYPIRRPDGTAAAVLTVPYVATSHSTARLAEVRAALERTAAEISARFAGRTAG